MSKKELSPKLIAMYEAVLGLFQEGSDINSITVAEITKKAGIGKGTAYDYVSNKEEIIAGALYYQMLTTCKELEDILDTKKSFFEKIRYLLCYIELQEKKGDCFLQILHIMSENSLISKLLYEMIENKEPDEILLKDVIQNVVLVKITAGKTIPKELMDYAVLNIVSKMFCYGMYLCDNRKKGEKQEENMCKLIEDGIFRETEFILQNL